MPKLLIVALVIIGTVYGALSGLSYVAVKHWNATHVARSID